MSELHPYGHGRPQGPLLLLVWGLESTGPVHMAGWGRMVSLRRREIYNLQGCPLGGQCRGINALALHSHSGV